MKHLMTVSLLTLMSIVALSCDSNESQERIDVPTGLVAEIDGETTPGALNRVRLSWSPVAGDVSLSGIVVYRSQNAGPVQRLIVLPAESTSYIDDDLAPGSYTYHVASLSSKDHESPLSSLASISPIWIDLVRIPAGTFMMGSEGANADERPAHQVEITRDFYLGKFEVTQQQFRALMMWNPSYFESPTRPVEAVSWDEAFTFVERLNALVNANVYRLPTEAEWEYACRAGTTTEYHFGDDVTQLGTYAWYRGNSDGETHPVGQKEPNAWGLHDMHGNVGEWVQDLYDAGYYGNAPSVDPAGPSLGTDHVLRGGGFDHQNEERLRAARRHGDTGRSALVGFRIARIAEAQ